MRFAAGARAGQGELDAPAVVLCCAPFHETRLDQAVHQPAGVAGLRDQQVTELVQGQGAGLPDHDQRVGLRGGQPERAHRFVLPALELALCRLDRHPKLQKWIHGRSVAGSDDMASKRMIYHHLVCHGSLCSVQQASPAA